MIPHNIGSLNDELERKLVEVTGELHTQAEGVFRPVNTNLVCIERSLSQAEVLQDG